MSSQRVSLSKRVFVEIECVEQRRAQTAVYLFEEINPRSYLRCRDQAAASIVQLQRYNSFRRSEGERRSERKTRLDSRTGIIDEGRVPGSVKSALQLYCDGPKNRQVRVCRFVGAFQIEIVDCDIVFSSDQILV